MTKKSLVLFVTLIITILLLGACNNNDTDAVTEEEKKTEAEKAAENTDLDTSTVEEKTESEERTEEEEEEEPTETDKEEEEKEVGATKENKENKNGDNEEGKKNEPAKASTPKVEAFSGEFTSKISLNVRSEPSLKSKQVTVIEPGTKGVASGKTTNDGIVWYKLNINGTDGWASSNYLIDFKDYTPPVVTKKDTTKKPATKAPAKDNVKETPKKETKPKAKPKKEEPKKEEPKKEKPKDKTPPKDDGIATPPNTTAYPSEVVRLINIERAKVGLHPLKENKKLSNVAYEKSKDMAVNGYFGHDSPTYGSPYDMMIAFGLEFDFGGGENIAQGYFTPEEVMRGWMNSEGHRRNILTEDYTEVGVGYYSDGSYWTQMFIGE